MSHKRRQLDDAFKRKVLAEYTAAKTSGNGARVLKRYGLHRSHVSDWIADGFGQLDRAAERAAKEEEKKAAAPLKASLAERLQAVTAEQAPISHKRERRRPVTDEEKREFLERYAWARRNGGQGRELMVEYGIGDLKIVRQWKKEFGKDLNFGEDDTTMEPQLKEEPEHEPEHTEAGAQPTANGLPPMAVAPRERAEDYSPLERAVILAQYADALDRDDKANLIRLYNISAQNILSWRNRKPQAFDGPQVTYANKPILTNSQKRLVAQAYYACPPKTRPVFLAATGVHARSVGEAIKQLTTPGLLERRKQLVDEWNVFGHRDTQARREFLAKHKVTPSDLSRWHVEEYGVHKKAPHGYRKEPGGVEPRAEIKERPAPLALVERRPNGHGPRYVNKAEATSERIAELEESNRILTQLLDQAEAQGFAGRAQFLARMERMLGRGI